MGYRIAPTGHGIPAQGETLGTRHTRPMRSEGTPQRSVGPAFEGCVSGAGSAGPWPPRAQEALGRLGFRAARGWVWCSPPRRATAKVPLRPGWCDGVWLRWGALQWGAAGRVSGVPQRGTAYQPRVKPWVRDTPSRCVLKERRIAQQARLSASAGLGVGSQTRSSTCTQPRGRLLRWVH